VVHRRGVDRRDGVATIDGHPNRHDAAVCRVPVHLGEAGAAGARIQVDEHLRGEILLPEVKAAKDVVLLQTRDDA
jgi:hypothetical protein